MANKTGFSAFFTTVTTGESLESAAQRAAKSFAYRDPQVAATYVFVGGKLDVAASPLPGLDLGRAKVGKCIVGVGVLE